MSKFTLFTFQTKKEELLKKLQIYENVHFRDLSEVEDDEILNVDFLNRDFSNEKYMDCSEELSKLNFISQKLTPLKQKENTLKKLTTPTKTFSYEEFEKFSAGYDYTSVYNELKEIDDEVRSLKQKNSKLETDNASYQNWVNLDVSTKDLSGLKFSSYALGSVNKTNIENFKEAFEKEYPNSYFEYLGDNKDDSQIIIIFEKSLSEEVTSFLRDNGFSKSTVELSDTASNLIRENTSQIKSTEKEIKELEFSNANFLTELDNIYILIDYYESLSERIKISERFLKTKDVLILEGWLPSDCVTELTDILESVCKNEYFIEFSEVEKESSEVPIKLKNNKIVGAFESVTSMFSMPKYNEIDPTPLLTPFYILFFGLMVGDLGYGITLLLGTLIALKFFNLKPGTRGFITFLFYCSFGVIFAGILFGGFFGFSLITPIPDPTSATGYKAILDSGNNQDVLIMMIASVILGAIQIFFGLGVKAYMGFRDKDYKAAVFDSIFWIIALSTGIMLILPLPVVAKTIAKWGFILSIIGLLATQGRDSPSIAGKIGNGVFGVYGITSYVGDFISYTRLVALCLSGGYVALSFNQMIDILPDNIIVKAIFGTAIFLIAQTVNMGLSFLSGYVHSSRLQYVEFFGKFYEGGGKPFKPFSLKNKYINVKE